MAQISVKTLRANCSDFNCCGRWYLYLPLIFICATRLWI